MDAIGKKDELVMHKFELNESNSYIKQVYSENNNYKIIHNDCNTNKCIVFFSGNGLYFPNTVEHFTEVVVTRDRYEWENVIKFQIIEETFQMIILVRDVYKTFYQRGINIKLDTIDKLLYFLKEITRGYQVVTCGNSAGGYMATIAGNYLNAQCVYNWGGQWDINNEPGYFLEKTKNKKYFNIVRFAKENVFWFFAAYNGNDLAQKEYLSKSIELISSFAIASKYHGDYLLYPCYKKVLTLSHEEMQTLCVKYNNVIISQRKFAKELLHGKELFKTCLEDIVRHHKSLQIMYTLFRKLIRF